MRFANKRLQAQGWILENDNEAVASGWILEKIASGWILEKDNEAVASFSEIPRPPLRTLHHCLVKKVMYHYRFTFKEALKQVMFFKIKRNLWENVQ